MTVDRLQIRVRGGQPQQPPRALAQAVANQLLPAMPNTRGLRSVDTVRVSQSGPVDAKRIAAAVLEALKRG
jgi:hypothetical protein